MKLTPIRFGAIAVTNATVSRQQTSLVTLGRNTQANAKASKETKIQVTLKASEDKDLVFKTIPGLQPGALREEPITLTFFQKDGSLSVQSTFKEDKKAVVGQEIVGYKDVFKGYETVQAGLPACWEGPVPEPYEQPVYEREPIYGPKMGIQRQDSHKTIALDTPEAFQDLLTLTEQIPLDKSIKGPIKKLLSHTFKAFADQKAKALEAELAALGESKAGALEKLKQDKARELAEQTRQLTESHDTKTKSLSSTQELLAALKKKLLR